MYRHRRGFYTFKVCMYGDKFERENGRKEFFDKNYGFCGKAFILVKKNCLGSFQLLKVVPLEKVQRNKLENKKFGPKSKEQMKDGIKFQPKFQANNVW